MRGSSPRPVKVEVSRGALLGREFSRVVGSLTGFSTLGLYENNDEITCVGGRVVEADFAEACCTGATESSASLRALLAGR